MKRTAFLLIVFAFGLRIGSIAYATVNEKQEQRAEQFCQLNPNYCNGQ
jgi:hypothetical protein